MAAGKVDAGTVIDDAVGTLKSKAAALKKGADAETAAAIDAALATAEGKAKTLTAALQSGKADASVALDGVVGGLDAAFRDIKEAKTSAGVDGAVKELTGACVRAARLLSTACWRACAR